MRIGIDARTLSGRYTGDRTYWLNLIKALAQSASADDLLLVYSRLPIPEWVLPDHPRMVVRYLPVRSNRFFTLSAFPRALRADGADVAHTQYTIPLRAPCPVVTTVHDISFKLFPEWFPARHRLLLNLTVPGSMRRAARVITDTESSRADILRAYCLPPDKLTAIPLAAGPEFRPVPRDQATLIAREKHGLDRPFVLSVGVLQPRKNLSLLVEAFARARARADLPHVLALTGKAGWDYEGLAPLAEQLGIRGSLRMTGYVEDADLPALYSACDLMAHPALYEGFGLTPVEAMACGAPVLVSDAPAMPEVAGDGACIVPARSCDAWADALARLLADSALRADLAARGLARSRRFSWARTAERTREVYERAVLG